jgi:hypothetical protein
VHGFASVLLLLLLLPGMMVNSIKKNASFVFPRLGLLVVLLWLLWFVNSVIQNTWMVLLKQVRSTHARNQMPRQTYVLGTLGVHFAPALTDDNLYDRLAFCFLSRAKQNPKRAKYSNLTPQGQMRHTINVSVQACCLLLTLLDACFHPAGPH